MQTARFDNVFCSQCGVDFGPGEHGFSHCDNHQGMSMQTNDSGHVAGGKSETDPSVRAAGLFEKRSTFGPWIEVERPTDKSVPLYTHPADVDAAARALEEIALMVSYIVMHGAGEQPEPIDNVPQAVRITPAELGRLIHQIGDTARAALRKAGVK